MNNLSTLKKRLKTRYILYRDHRRTLSKEKQKLSLFDFPKLTADEVQKVKQQWKGLHFTEKLVQGHRIYKAVHGFDARYLTTPIYDPMIIRVLNPFATAKFFGNKCLFCNFFSNLLQPKCYVKRIGDEYFDGNMSLINKKQAFEILSRQEKYIIKPGNDSYGGAGIQIIQQNSANQNIQAVFDAYKKDFIVQEIVKQHPDTAIFNPSSLNTIRVLSLLINGRVVVLKAALRCGQHGALVDNASSGGLMIKINENGMLNDFGIDTRFRKIYQTDSGLEFKGRTVSCFQKIEKLVVENHPKLYPALRLIAWDFAIDVEGNPIFIEGNARYPGIFWIQLSAGPVFENHIIEELIEFVNKHS